MTDQIAMKNTIVIPILISFALLFTNNVFALNAIDSIKTDEDALNFINRIVPDNNHMKSFGKYYGQTQSIADSLGVRNWTKVDMDNNGETDLLVIYPGWENGLFVIFCEKRVFIKKIVNNTCKQRVQYPLIGLANNKPALLLYYQQEGFDNSIKAFTYSNLYCDTIVVKDYHFLNFIASPKKYNIEKIVIRSNGICEGDCPIITVNIDAPTLEYTCDKYYFNPYLGTYKGVFEKATVQRIISLLQYSNFPNLKDSFRILCYDFPTTTLTITYNNGRTKTISDYGASGNFTLEAIYDLTYNPTWIEDKKSSP